MLGARIASAAVLAPLAVGLLLAGPPGFQAFVIVAAAVMTWEWQNMLAGGLDTGGWVLIAILASAGGWVAGGGPAWQALPAMVVPLPLMLWQARRRRVARWRLAGAAPAYIGLPSVAMLAVEQSGGTGTVIWLLAIVWSADTAAYIVGTTLGGPRLAPAISPGKTWAGTIGGVVAGTAGSVAFGTIVPDGPGALLWAAAGGTVAVASQVGDLLESGIKRLAGVRHASHVIPGHGGVMDRVDGLVVAAPLVAAWVWLAGGGIEAWS